MACKDPKLWELWYIPYHEYYIRVPYVALRLQREVGGLAAVICARLQAQLT